jgi:hypothetical protein
MKAKVFIPRDSTALAAGADATAQAIAAQARARKLNIDIVRTGSRGLFWLEPMVEVETAKGRIGYGPIGADDATTLFDSGFLTGGAHAKALGLVEEIPFLKQQQRLVFARCGMIDPLSLEDYRRHGGLSALSARLPWGRKRRSTKSWLPACAVAAARDSRPGSNGAPSRAPTPSTNMWSATLTKATAALSPTACCWKATRSC